MKNKLLSAPYIVWMLLFILVPLCIVLYYAFTDSMTGAFTLSNLGNITAYLPIFLRSIWLALIAALICLVIGYPVAYFIAQCRQRIVPYIRPVDFDSSAACIVKPRDQMYE